MTGFIPMFRPLCRWKTERLSLRIIYACQRFVNGLSTKLRTHVTLPNELLFEELCHLMDSTPFTRAPFRGILTKVAEQFNYKGGRRSVYQAIKVNRNIDVMMAVAAAIQEVNIKISNTITVLQSNTPQQGS